MTFDFKTATLLFRNRVVIGKNNKTSIANEYFLS